MKKIDNVTPIHHYNGRLLVGDAYEIIKKMKDSIGGEHPFIDTDEGEFYNQIEDIKKTTNLKYFCMPHSGGAIHQLFYTYKNKFTKNGFYIDTASTEFRFEPWVPKEFYSTKHFDELYENIQKSVKNSKPISTFECSSEKILLCQGKDEVLFYVDIKDKERAIIDYKNNSVNSIIKELEEYCFEPKVKFLNHFSNTNDYTYDFYIDDVFIKKFEIYEIFFQKQNLNDFSKYYSKYYANEKNLKEKKVLDDKGKKQMKEWTERELGRYGMNPDEIFGKNHLDKGTAPIEKYERYIDDNKYFMGYYFKGV